MYLDIHQRTFCQTKPFTTTNVFRLGSFSFLLFAFTCLLTFYFLYFFLFLLIFFKNFRNNFRTCFARSQICVKKTAQAIWLGIASSWASFSLFFLIFLLVFLIVFIWPLLLSFFCVDFYFVRCFFLLSRIKYLRRKIIFKKYYNGLRNLIIIIKRPYLYYFVYIFAPVLQTCGRLF